MQKSLADSEKKDKNFKRLAWLTVAFTFLLMFWGNLVSATGSGLACPDWPLCHGTVIPPARMDVILEWGHRILASISTVLILSTFFQYWRRAKKDHHFKNTTRVLLLLLTTQILLGGLTVVLELSVLVSTIHLATATIIFSGLIFLASSISRNGDPQIPSTQMGDQRASSSLQKVLTFGLFALFLQFILGGLVRHGHAGLACANYPACLDGFLPIPFTLETFLAFTHRWWGMIVFFTLLTIFFMARKTGNRELKKLSFQIVTLGIFQFSLGILTVLSSLATDMRALHAGFGYALWGLLFYLSLRAGCFSFFFRKNRTAPSFEALRTT